MNFVHVLLFVLQEMCRLRCATVSAVENLVEDGSFEVRDTGQSSWKTTDRSSTWSTSIDSQSFQYCLFRRSGCCSVNFAGPQFRNIDAAFMSQYIDIVGRLGTVTSGAVRLEFWTSGRQSSKLRARLDIAYADDYRRMSAALSPAGGKDYVEVTDDLHPDEQFVKSCVIVPNYGRIRAMMLHFVIEHKLAEDDDIYLDDVDLRFISPDDAALLACPLYLDSSPVSRHVLNDFLRPANGHPCGAKDAEDVTGPVSGITLATQLTVDRVAMLRRAVSEWNGPVSAALLVFFDPARGNLHTELNQITSAYYSSSHLRSCATIHVVVEDLFSCLGRPDSVHYPANFLRDVAIAHAHTSHVFYIDVDVFPAFDERQARRWVLDVDEADRPRAYVVPLFHCKDHRKHSDEFPRTKPELRAAIRDPQSGLEPFLVVSHAPVQYGRWMKIDEPYAINYVENMEPYLIIRSSAPVMSDAYVGYGGDRCAYVSDVARAGYQFIVLPHAFLYNVVDAPGAPTILSRSGRIHLNVFINTAFHKADMEAGFLHLPSLYHGHSRPPFTTNQERHQSEKHGEVEITPQLVDTDDDDRFTGDRAEGRSVADEHSDSEANKDEAPLSETLSEEKSDLAELAKSAAHALQRAEGGSARNSGGDSDKIDRRDSRDEAVVTFDQLPTIAEAEATGKIVSDRLDMVVEGLMMSLGVTTYVQLVADEIERSVGFFLRLMQPDAVLVVTPYANDNSQAEQDGLIRKYLTRGNLYSVLPRLIADYPRPKIFVLVFDSSTSARPEAALEHIRATVSHATDADVILLSGRSTKSSPGGGRVTSFGFRADADFLSEIATIVATLQRGWRLYRCAERLILKSADLHSPPPIRVPTLPVCRRPEVDSAPAVVVDVVLVTRNRPMQTMSFLEGLSKYVAGVRTVWIVWKSDVNEFRRAYDEIAACVTAYRHQYSVEWVEERPDGQLLGDLYVDVVERRSNATHLLLCVDELMWLSRIDLVGAVRQAQLDCDAQQQNGDEVFGVQLRLGQNVALYRQLSDKHVRFRRLPYDDDDHDNGEHADDGGTEMWAYYPRQLPYDFGWVLQLDGLLLRRADVVRDFAGFARQCSSPGCLEMGWIAQSLHVHSRQWQAMYTTSRLVNNALPNDQRVSRGGSQPPHDGSFALADQFSRHRLKIDVDAFAADNARPDAVHLRVPVKLIDRADC